MNNNKSIAIRQLQIKKGESLQLISDKVFINNQQS